MSEPWWVTGKLGSAEWLPRGVNSELLEAGQRARGGKANLLKSSKRICGQEGEIWGADVHRRLVTKEVLLYYWSRVLEFLCISGITL